MRIHRGFDALPDFVRPVVTVGSYDGVHAGHRELLGRIVGLARRDGGESVVITFSPHPRTVLGNRGEKVELLNTPDEKAMLLDSLGVDHLIVAPFTPEFSRVESYDFVRHYLVGRVGVACLVVGFNHHFGHNHAGDFDYLKRLQSQFGFGIYEIPEKDVCEHRVSSTAIRRLIREGDMEQAAAMLAFPYFMIASGGRHPRPQEPEKLLPPSGSYAVDVYAPGILPEAAGPITSSRLEVHADGSMEMEYGGVLPDEFIVAFGRKRV